ncbi:MAG: glycosyltransferase family A protein [Candidatus Celaenobacter polaris]|nr:glycosyltransferase family A protein [Candidatus Celaenobacter polaris]
MKQKNALTVSTVSRFLKLNFLEWTHPCKINYYYQHQQGPAVARNTGIKKSSNEYIAFLYVAQKAGYKTFCTSAYHTKNFKTVPFYLIIINYAAFVGLLKYLFRTQKVTWERPQ